MAFILSEVVKTGFKTKINVKSEPRFSNSVIQFQLNRLRENDYIFTDEWDVGGYRLHLGYFVGLRDPQEYYTSKILTRIAKARPSYPDKFNMQKYIEKLHEMAKISDEDIELRVMNAFTRDSPYWNEYKQSAISYIKAKRDYVCCLTQAGIQEVVYLPESTY